MKQNSLQAWVLAARPKTLTAALIPVLLGGALAFSEGKFQVISTLLCALFACGMQIAANFINDLYDFRKGTDREDRLGPERACAQGWISPEAMKTGIGLMLTFSSFAGLTVLFHLWGELPHGEWELILLGGICILFAFLYTTKLSYSGWGDILVLVFFGFVPVCGTYYIQTYTLNADVLVLSAICGLVIDALLILNNYRDRDQDAISGKNTLIVRYGEKFGRILYLSTGIIACALCLYLVAADRITPLEFMWAPGTYLCMHTLTWWKMSKIRSGKKLNSILGETSRNMLFFGLLLSIALAN